MLSNTRFGSSPPARHVRKGAPAPPPAPESAPTPPPAPKLWKAMHHPKWEGVHPESDAFFAMGKYKFAIHDPTTPKSLLSEINIGDRIIVQPRTMFRKNGQRLKSEKKSNQFRYGTITTESRLEEDQIGTDCPLYGFCVDWDDSFVPSDPTIINKPFKTFTLIK